MPPLSTGHVFISYSRRDTEAMIRIVSFLRGQGIKAWVDNEKLVPGTPIWEREIEKAIDAAYAVVVVLSPDAKESVWVLNELTLADEYKKRVFPVLVRGDFRESVHFRLVTRQFVDLRTNEERGLESLGAALSRYLDELKHIEEERQAAEQETERLAEEKRLAEEAETGQKAKAEAQRLVPERPVEAERQEKERAERFAAQKVEDERRARTRLDVEPFLEENHRKYIQAGSLAVEKYKVFLLSWKGRMLLGGLVGLIALFVMSLVPQGYFEASKNVYVLLSLLATNTLAGLITYPHKSSIAIVVTGFLVTGSAYSIRDGPSSFDLNFFIGLGCTVGTFLGALVSRILSWIKVIT